jgi:hypothetical protein
MSQSVHSLAHRYVYSLRRQCTITQQLLCHLSGCAQRVSCELLYSCNAVLYDYICVVSFRTWCKSFLQKRSIADLASNDVAQYDAMHL